MQYYMYRKLIKPFKGTSVYIKCTLVKKFNIQNLDKYSLYCFIETGTHTI